MALRALLLSLCLPYLVHYSFSLPLDAVPTDGLDTTTEIVIVTAVVTSNVEVLETSTVLLVPTSPSQPTPTPAPDPTSPAASQTQYTQPSLPAPSLSAPVPVLPPSPAPSTVVDFVTVTDTITPPAVTITVEDPPITITEVVTSSSANAAPAPTSPPADPAPSSSTANATAWTAPAQMTDLSCFNVSHFAYGQSNMQIVQGVPASASPTGAAALAVPSAPLSAPPWDNSSSVIQLFYPAGSVNPTTQPQGGADFYAAPLDISAAHNVSLEYSVFFPADFDWVRAGKLPGIYGGHKTCSGGDDALSCFSTRLMWREGGAGELYLYAPKDRQTEALCSTPPTSVCDATYGLSIGRGAWNFTPGAWTHVRQTVWLNTPGLQDGGFVLEVDGLPVINRTDVFYRDVASATPPTDDGGDNGGDPDYDEPELGGGDAGDEPEDGGDGGGDDGGDEGGDDGGDGEDSGDDSGGDDDNSGVPEDGTDPSPSPSPAGPSPADPSPAPDPPQNPAPNPPAPAPAPAPAPPPQTPQAPPSAPVQDPGLGGLLGPLAPLLNGLGSTLPLKRQDPMYAPYAPAGPPAVPAQVASSVAASTQFDTATATTTSTASTQTVVVQTTVTTTAFVEQATSPAGSVQALSQDPQPIGFSGLFFSSFFGGHEDDYKTPRDQYTWFKDFSMTINN